MTDYKDFKVWIKSIQLVENIYLSCQAFPPEERYALVDQMKRSAISIPSNIAESSVRNTTKEFVQFLYIALGSACEPETQLIIAKEVGYIDDIPHYTNQINEIQKMLNGLINSLKQKGSR